MERHADSLVLILLDLTMPVLSGEETLSRIRQSHPEIPVLLMSGYAESQVAQRFVDRGVAGFLQKPFTSQALGEMARAFSRSRLA